MVLFLSEKHYFYLKLGEGYGSDTRAELIALWALLLFAKGRGIRQIQIMGDSKVVIDWLCGQSLLNNLLFKPWKKRIQDLQESYEDIIINHTYKVYNHKEDFLSKEALGLDDGLLVFTEFLEGEPLPEVSRMIY